MTGRGDFRVRMEIERLLRVAELRRSSCRDELLLGMSPTLMDWMTSEELEKLHRLELRLPTLAEERMRARRRVMEKRRRRCRR